MENEQLITKLYEHMKGRCNYESHSGTAIYFCIYKTCHERYLCSECLIERVEHFTNHVKNLIPLDNKSKFTKTLNLTNTTRQNNFDLDIKDKIANLYNEIKESINTAVDKHMKINLENLCEAMNNKIGSKNNANGNETTKAEVNKEIETFINYKDKSTFNELLEALSSKLNKLNEQITSEKKKEFNFTVNTNFIEAKVDEIIKEHFLITKQEIISNNNFNTSNSFKQVNSRNEKFFTFSDEYDGDSKLNQTAQFDDISEFSKRMGFNRDFSFSNQTRKDEILNTLNTETNEEDVTRRNNIKSRLNDLKLKLNQLK
jgi:hypothetical protein